MTSFKWFGLLMLAAAIALSAIDLGARYVVGVPGLVSEAQAVVGRPLTPVSVAGVGRRTARRCAAGVYNC